MPGGNAAGKVVHGSALLAHGPMALGVESDLPFAARQSEVEDDVSNAAKHARAALVGLAFRPHQLISIHGKMLAIPEIHELVRADPDSTHVLLDGSHALESAGGGIGKSDINAVSELFPSD